MFIRIDVQIHCRRVKHLHATASIHRTVLPKHIVVWLHVQLARSVFTLSKLLCMRAYRALGELLSKAPRGGSARESAHTW